MSHREMMPSDFLKLTNVDYHVLEEERGVDLLMMSRLRIAQGPCATIFEGDRILACGGICIIHQGTAGAWVRLSLPTGAHVAFEVRDILMGWAESEKLDRIQAITEENWPVGQHFLEWIGMEWEGVLHKYGPHGVNQLMYAWVRR